MEQKIKPSLISLLIPIVFLVLGTVIGGILIADPVTEMMGMDSKALGEEFEFEAVEEDAVMVYLELPESADISSITVDADVTTVVITDGDKVDTYEFLFLYYGDGTVTYEVMEFEAETTVNNMRLIFSYVIDADGQYGVIGTGTDNVDFSVNKIEFEDLFIGIFGGIAAFLGFGFVAVISLIIILVKRSKSKRENLLEQDRLKNMTNTPNPNYYE